MTWGLPCDHCGLETLSKSSYLQGIFPLPIPSAQAGRRGGRPRSVTSPKVLGPLPNSLRVLCVRVHVCTMCVKTKVKSRPPLQSFPHGLFEAGSPANPGTHCLP